jgi:hypothetical protein
MWLPIQVLHLEPQGRCLNDANARRGRKPRLPPPPELPIGTSLQDLCAAYQRTGVAFLDLQKMHVQPEAGISDAGPAACMAGSLHHVQGQLGAPSQASPHSPPPSLEAARVIAALTC